MAGLKDFKKIVDTNLSKLDMSEESKDKLKKSVHIKRRKFFKPLSFVGIPTLAALVAFIVLVNGLTITDKINPVLAKDLMGDIKAEEVVITELSEEFIQSTADFSVELFKNSYTKGKNSLFSPTSVYLALGMTANGAKGNTLKEFESLLGKKGLGINDLNNYYYSLSKNLTNVISGKVGIANSIWYKDDDIININKEFLQKNANYYKAAAYKVDFSSKETATYINNWVKKHTGNLIDKIIDKTDDNDIMHLINTVYFEDEWQVPYENGEIDEGEFRLEDGTRKKVEFMTSTESYYIKDDKAEGFIKPYKNGKYSFLALLPNEEVSVDSYIDSLSGERFIKLMENKSSEDVRVSLPKFKASYSKQLKDSLMQMGLVECFDSNKADFSEMTRDTKLYVDYVFHKTFIRVDDLGTKAGAVSDVGFLDCAVEFPEHEIFLDRPFIYAIIDNETNLPLFIGTMMNPEN
ncbi:MAG: serine protease [Clostridiales bacterium]|nr:serine protease [Clostridiales bacterium]